MKEQLRRVVKPIIEAAGPPLKFLDGVVGVYGVLALNLGIVAYSAFSYWLTNKIESWVQAPQPKMA